MGVLTLRFRSELRTSWRAWLALALVGGLAGAVVTGAAVGARRTDSVYERFLHASRASDVVYLDDTEGTPHAPDPRLLARLPHVQEVVPLQFVGYGLGDNAIVAAIDGRPGRTIDRFKVIAGRLPDPRRADEAVVGFALAEKRHLRVGDTFPLLTREDLAAAAREGVRVDVPNMRLRIVGVEASPGEFPPQPPGLWPIVHLTPAFYRRYARTELLRPQWPSLLVRLEHGQKDVPAFVAAVERLSHGKPTFAQTQREQGAPVRQSFHLQAIALWILAALSGATAALVFGQLLSRQAFLDSTEAPILRSLGMTRAQLLVLGMARAGAVAVPAAAVAAAGGVLLSPLTPIGVARIAEPSPGLRLDSVAVAAGAAGTATLIVLLAVPPVWRAARSAGSPLGTPVPARRARASPVAGVLARATSMPTVVAGARLALEQGRGRTAVPVRATLAGLVVAVTALTASLVFGASLDRLLATPRLYGLSWDLQVTNYGAGPNLESRAARIGAVPGVAQVSIGESLPVHVGVVRNVGALATDGPVAPPLVEGRRPVARNEIALGAKTMRRAGVGIGDSVDVRVPGLAPLRMAVVGRVVVPPQQISPQLGEGALLSQAGARTLIGRRLAAGSIGTDVYARLAPGADRRRVLAALRQAVGRGFAVVEPQRPADIVNFGRVQRLPAILAGILALLVAATLAVTLVSSVRRRARDVAVLRTLGFVHRQVVAVVLWQATTLAGLAVLVGVPLGAGLGRWAWSLFADRAGVVREPVVPAWQVVVVVAGALLVANAVAVVPGRVAARTSPVRALRAE
ncbi:MAG TPA: FtsX-like permease family protein [Gaiellaceae bacterium]|nr:FtsX-like permease family protein [Gaiellaceae bacterium]